MLINATRKVSVVTVDLLGSANSPNLRKVSTALRNSISKQAVNVNTSFLQQAFTDKTFSEMSRKVRESNKAFYLSKLHSATVYSAWHFLGEPCARGTLFSQEFANQSRVSDKQKCFGKLLGKESLVHILEKTQSLKKILISDKKDVPQPKRESDLKALHDPIREVPPLEEEAPSPRKLITDWLEGTPDYLNFFPKSSCNVLIHKAHILPENIISEVMQADCMINLDQLLDMKDLPKSDTFFRTIVSPNMSTLAFKLHLISLILSKPNRASFGLSHLDVDPKVV